MCWRDRLGDDDAWFDRVVILCVSHVKILCFVKVFFPI